MDGEAIERARDRARIRLDAVADDEDAPDRIVFAELFKGAEDPRRARAANLLKTVNIDRAGALTKRAELKRLIFTKPLNERSGFVCARPVTARDCHAPALIDGDNAPGLDLLKALLQQRRLRGDEEERGAAERAEAEEKAPSIGALAAESLGLIKKERHHDEERENGPEEAERAVKDHAAETLL